MKLGFMTIAKVYRKKDVQEITDRSTGRVTGEYYPVILDDGEDTIDATVPKDVYNGIEEDNIYLFAGTYDDRFKRENTTPKPRITAVLYPINEPWRRDFIDEFSKQTYDSFAMPFKEEQQTNASATAPVNSDDGLPFGNIDDASKSRDKKPASTASKSVK